MAKTDNGLESQAIAGRRLLEWIELAKRDDCFAHMVPSDLRMILRDLSAARELWKHAYQTLEKTRDELRDLKDEIRSTKSN